MNVLICVGCDKYDFLQPLHGAEKDAREMYDALSYNGFYDTANSNLLLSPSISEVAKTLAAALRKGRASVFTFFFAGHAAGNNGSFFIALRDSESDALSATAFPLSRLFEMINEFQPSQVNLIIDGCEAGSSTSSMHTLLRSDDVGSIRASSVSFLGACAASQFAGESAEGGLLTRHILRVLGGESDLVINNPCIELNDIAAHVSESVAHQAPDQHPTWWGLNLFGRGGLAFNPIVHIESPLPALFLTTVDPGSKMGRRLTELSSELWDEYRLISKEFDPLRLNLLLHRLLSPANITINDRAAAIAGLVRSFSSVASADGEMLSQLLCSAACLTPLLPWIDDSVVRDLVRQQLQADWKKANYLLTDLQTEMCADESRLLANNGVLSDIYYMPLRITRLLGLLGALALIGKILNFETEASKSLHRKMVGSLISIHSKLLVALDDEQAAPLYVFLKAAQRMTWTEEGQEVVQSLYIDAANRAGIFNRVNSSGEEALEHILAISQSKLATQGMTPANPSSLLPVILLGGVWFACDSIWDLQAFDRRQIGLFFPNNFRDFSEEVITNGYTHTWQIGFGIWNTAQLATAFCEILTSRTSDASLPPEGHALCILAALLFPDRIPLALELLEEKMD